MYSSETQVIINVCDMEWTHLRVVHLPRIPQVEEHLVYIEPTKNEHFVIKNLLWVINEFNHLSVMVACESYTESKLHLKSVPIQTDDVE